MKLDASKLVAAVPAATVTEDTDAQRQTQTPAPAIPAPSPDDDIPDARDALKAVTSDEPIPPSADAPKTYTVRGLVEIARLHLPPAEEVWNGLNRNPGAIAEVIGSPGIGKSRFVGDEARHQILGLPFGGRATFPRPLKWLFIGSENGIRRLQNESRRFLFGTTKTDDMSEDELLALASKRNFNPGDLDLLDRNFRTFTLEDPADCYISLADELNIAKLTATLAAEKPDIVVFDPWGDVIAGDELKDAEVRETVQIIRKVERDAGLSNALTVIINHARIGAKEEALARGMDAGNFGKNSKCLYSIARYVLNIRRGSFDDNPPIEVICAKNNDGPKPSPVAFELDADTMSYRHLPDFDHDAWQAALEEKAGIKARTSASSEETRTAIETAAFEICAKVGDDLLTATDFKNAVMNEVGGKKTAVENFLASAFKVKKTLARTAKAKPSKGGSFVRDGRKEVVGTPDQIAAYRQAHPLAGEDVLI